jgi:hypothetical protein
MAQELAERDDGVVAMPASALRVGFGRGPGARAPSQVTGAWLRAMARELGPAATTVAILLATTIAVLGVLGAVHDASGQLAAFDLDAEVPLHGLIPEPNNVPVVLSSLLLLLAGGLALIMARTRDAVWLGMAAIFIYMGADELLVLHERVGDWAGVPWLIPYAPLIVAIGAVWLTGLARVWESQAQMALWVGGAAAWVCAQGFEALWYAVGSSTGPMSEFSIPEETLEMLGSAMFLLALYLVARDGAGARR